MAAPKDDVQAAIKKISDDGNYTWTETTANANAQGGGGRGFGGGPVQGKITKEGTAWVSTTFGENTSEGFVKGAKGAVKNQEGVWQSLEELTAAAGQGQGGGRRGGGRGGVANRLRTFKAPGVTAEELLGKIKEVKMADGAYSGDLPADAVAPLLTFGGGGRRGGGEAPPPPANAKGSIKYWIKDGALSKYELKVQGTLSFGDNSFEVDRTTTVEIKDVGATKVEVPEDAKKKLM